MINTVRLDGLVDEIMREVQIYAENGFPNKNARQLLVDKISDILYDGIDEVIESENDEEDSVEWADDEFYEPL